MGKKEDDETEAKTLEYLLMQNRPYNLTDIFMNLHQKYGKAALQKALTKLSEGGQLVEKTNGKQKIYYAKQDEGSAANQAELDALDANITKLKEKVLAAGRECDTMSAALKGVGSSMTRDEVLAELARLQAKNSADAARLDALQATDVPIISPEERAAADKLLSVNLKEYRKRKRLCKDMVDTIMEGYPKKLKQLHEEVGIETDEDAKVDLSALK